MFLYNLNLSFVEWTKNKKTSLKQRFKEVLHYFVLFILDSWSGKRDSNSRPQPWQGCALPTELFPRMLRFCFSALLFLAKVGVSTPFGARLCSTFLSYFRSIFSRSSAPQSRQGAYPTRATERNPFCGCKYRHFFDYGKFLSPKACYFSWGRGALFATDGGRRAWCYLFCEARTRSHINRRLQCSRAPYLQRPAAG